MADVDRVQLPQTSPSTANSTTGGHNSTLNAQEMNSQAPASANNGSQRPNILTGQLPDNFLRLEPGVAMQAVTQPPTVFAAGGAQFYPTYYQKGGILTCTISQARLAKNYGLSRMDPYCRIRVGNSILETPTSYNGSKNPRWNKAFQIPLPDGMNRMYIEVFDECSFSPDERIAWGLIIIKDEVIAGETVDDWYSLSGKQGDDKEGMINIVLQYREAPIPAPTAAPLVMQPAPMMMAYGSQMAYAYPPGYAQPLPVTQQQAQFHSQPLPQQPPPPQQQQTIPDEDVKKIKDMFPDMEEDIIRSVLVSSGGNVDSAVNHLLSMTAS